MSPKLQEQFDKMVAEGKLLQGKKPTPSPPSRNAPQTYPPLVEKIQLQEPILRQTTPVVFKEQELRQSMPIITQPFSSETPKQTPFMEGATYIIDGFFSFFNFLLAQPSIYQGKGDIEAFVGMVSSIDKACGCVRGSLNERAASMYAQMLPILQVKYPDFFSQMKTVTSATRILFKEGATTLLEV